MKLQQHRNEDPPIVEQVLQTAAILATAAIVAALSFTLIGWYRRQNQPFCSGVRRTGDCIPCPEHGICHGGELECFVGFKRHGKTCVRDESINKGAGGLLDTIKGHVCNSNAQSICNGGSAVWLTEKEVLEDLRFNKAAKSLISDAKNFKLAEGKALALADEELLTRWQSGKEYSCPQSLVQKYKPLSCYFRDWFSPSPLEATCSCILVILMGVLLCKYWRHRAILKRAETLYTQVCESLESKALSATDVPGKETWIVASRLRDHLLRPSERRNSALWKEVERLVQEDSRIDQHPMMVKGESRVVWEWQVEGAPHSPFLTALRHKDASTFSKCESSTEGSCIKSK